MFLVSIQKFLEEDLLLLILHNLKNVPLALKQMY